MRSTQKLADNLSQSPAQRVADLSGITMQLKLAVFVAGRYVGRELASRLAGVAAGS